MYFNNTNSLIPQSEALVGRKESLSIASRHHVLQTPLEDEFTLPLKSIVFGMGCFWGAERLFWMQEGVYSTSVGYAGGYTPNPSYQEVCSGQTAHTEAVRVIYDSDKISLEKLLSVFWNEHNPTQGMRQGNDRGTQYRSAIYTFSGHDNELCLSSKNKYQQALIEQQFDPISTEIKKLDKYYFAEDYHQQYLAKNPNGYCGLKGTGVIF